MNPRARRLRRQRRKPWVVRMVRCHPSGIVGTYEARARRIIVNELREGKRLETVIIDGDQAIYVIHTGRKAPSVARRQRPKIPHWDPPTPLEAGTCQDPGPEG